MGMEQPIPIQTPSTPKTHDPRNKNFNSVILCSKHGDKNKTTNLILMVD